MISAYKDIPWQIYGRTISKSEVNKIDGIARTGCFQKFIIICRAIDSGHRLRVIGWRALRLNRP